jgi:two-component system response regulator MtrA
LIDSTVLIVSDDPTTSGIWSMCVTVMRCQPIVASSKAEALASLEGAEPDLIVVDVTARQTSGVELCAELRERSGAPLLLLTPINNESHSLEAYAAGADECIIKPISPALFMAKSKAWLRREWTLGLENLEKLHVGDLTLDPVRHQLARRGGEPIRLSKLEFRMLYLFASHPKQSLATNEIMIRVWGLGGEGSSVLVKNVIYRLRKKIEPNPNRPRHLQTVTGGYLFQP